MITSILRRTAVLALCTLMAACSDPIGPSDVAGVYELELIDGEPLPAVLFSNEYYIVRVLSDTITLRADGTGTISGVQEFESLQEGVESEGPRARETQIRFGVRNNRIDIEFLCPPNALCTQGPHIVAWKTSDGLSARYPALGPGLIYTRISDALHWLRERP